MTNDNLPGILDTDEESARLKLLEQCEIIDTPPEEDYQAIADLAARIFGCDQACITFMDNHEVFVKASLDKQIQRKIPKEQSLSALCVKKRDTLLYSDIRQVSGLADSLVFTGPAQQVRFFAAAPLLTESGYALGTISVFGPHPKTDAGETQLKMLELLAGIVMDMLRTRMENRRKVHEYDLRLHQLVHDMKNPVTSISLYAQLLSNREMSAEKVFSMASKIEKSTKVIESNLNSLIGKN